MGYVRDILAMVSLKSLFQQWGPGSRQGLAMKREEIANLQSELASANRRIGSMEQLRERFKDEKDVPASSPSSPVQVQVTGTRNLSPFQQIIGLETDRAEAMERLKLAERDRLRLETLVGFFDLFDSHVGNGASLDLTKEVLSRAKQPGLRSGGDEANAVERALAIIGVGTQGILTRFSEAKTNPVEPETRSVGVGRLLAVLFGMLAAAAVWLLLVLMLPGPRPRPDGAI
jgi:hypothetical protein